jgi:hemerythrin
MAGPYSVGLFQRKQEWAMALITWDDGLSVNVAEIDSQHKTLVGMLNDLHDAMKKGEGRRIIDGIVKGLVDYSITHFATEEKYFKLYNYHGTDAHTREHQDFIAQVSEFKRAAAARGGSGLSIEVMQFLKDWLLKHIKGSDKDYSAYFNQQGLR